MNILGHFRTITKHRLVVRKYCFKLGLYKQGLIHDMSKYSPTEFFLGCKYFLGYRSPNDAERKEKGFSEAWMHHKGRNKHHPEYWSDYSPNAERKYMAVKMPIKYVAEMFCDRVAACKIYHKKEYKDSDPYDYLIRSRKHIDMHPDTYQMIEKMLVVLKDEGEEKAIKFIKEKLKDKNY